MRKRIISRTTQIAFLIIIFALSFNVDPIKPEVFNVFLPQDFQIRYHNYTEIVDIILHTNNTYPSITDVFSIGKSYLNASVYCVRLTNENITHPKPKVLFVGYHHAREPISAELPLYFIVEATTTYNTDITITNLLDFCEIYIIVALNPDGFAAVEQNHWQRKNVQPIDEDQDGFVDEDPPDDEDGDGFIEWLWQWNGTDWAFIRWEGNDDDDDGLLNEDWIGGVDLNRNYGYQWNATTGSGSPNPSEEDYKGPAPFSEKETQALRGLVLENDFTYAVSFHSGIELILYPWGYSSMPTPHDSLFKEIAGDISALVNAPYAQSAGGLYTLSGTWADWMYGNRNVLAFTCEIYKNDSAWESEPGPLPNSFWERGIFEFFNPSPDEIEPVINRWLPVFTYLTNRTISEAYDVAITSINPAESTIFQGRSTDVNVSVANQGQFTETFNVSLFANVTLIESQEVTLTGGNSTTINFVWNTSEWASGNYEISADTSPIPGEIFTSDNTLIDGTITLRNSYDVTGDGYVGIDDIVAVAEHFGQTPTHTDWDEKFDLTRDGYVGIDDIVLIAEHFGETA
ncbi:MAG: hypothetical protein JSV05_02590 [Candidatus Bathyarchaeota archaeon]|nr:MAG: hypothetical protein JSV05_02590 [Candidatus Bathyarchaeota archaeon]